MNFLKMLAIFAIIPAIGSLVVGGSGSGSVFVQQQAVEAGTSNMAITNVTAAGNITGATNMTTAGNMTQTGNATEANNSTGGIASAKKPTTTIQVEKTTVPDASLISNKTGTPFRTPTEITVSPQCQDLVTTITTAINTEGYSKLKQGISKQSDVLTSAKLVESGDLSLPSNLGSLPKASELMSDLCDSVKTGKISDSAVRALFGHLKNKYEGKTLQKTYTKKELGVTLYTYQTSVSLNKLTLTHTGLNSYCLDYPFSAKVTSASNTLFSTSGHVGACFTLTPVLFVIAVPPCPVAGYCPIPALGILKFRITNLNLNNVNDKFEKFVKDTVNEGFRALERVDFMLAVLPAAPPLAIPYPTSLCMDAADYIPQQYGIHGLFCDVPTGINIETGIAVAQLLYNIGCNTGALPSNYCGAGGQSSGTQNVESGKDTKTDTTTGSDKNKKKTDGGTTKTDTKPEIKASEPDTATALRG
jgi:hypothetical protein